eukprot:TCALIF_03687-PA protein Name:"Similar to unc-22 Twitchin (Caenorhabditis elegans)" AED:0.03 eAED:0.03 QI:253/0.88/0.9/1/0.88/0.9/10/156/900
MGNQSAKIHFKNQGHSDRFVGNVDQAFPEEKSRADWAAGCPSPPGRPTIELSNQRTDDADENAVTDEINLSWNVPEDDGGYPIIGYRVEMLDIQSGYWIEITSIEGYEPKCTLSNILYGIMYRFRVLALNDVGVSEPGEPSDPVVIDVPGVQIAPYFVQMVNDTIALEHEKVEFRVRVLGTPKPTVQWYKDELEIFSCDRIEMREEEEGGVVILKSARLSDSGNVKCVAINIMGKAVSTAQLVIEATPRFDLPESYSEGLIFREDEVIRIKVPFVAKPTPKIVWFFEDEPITSPGPEIQIDTSESQTSLRIQNAKRWHCGEFRVYAENENGEDAASILVTVTSPPSPPGMPVVIDISETRCTLRWDPSSDDGGTEIKHYVVEYFRDVWNVWLKARTTKEYMFRVKAENSYGISEPGPDSDPFDVGSGASSERQSKTYSEAESWSNRSMEGGDLQTSMMESETPTIVFPDQKASASPSALSKTKLFWPSDDKEDDILDRYLKVQTFKDLRIPSCESDGMPSIVGIDEDNMSDTSDMDRTHRMFDEIQQISSDDVEDPDDEEDPSLSEFHMEPNEQEYAQHHHGSMDSINISLDSIASVIPPEKKEAMNNFEENLNAMIQEAQQDMVEVHPEKPTYSDTPPENPPIRGRPRKSSSALSTPESIVSVIEMPLVKQGKADVLPTPAISVTQEEIGRLTAKQQQQLKLNQNDPDTLDRDDLYQNIIRAPPKLRSERSRSGSVTDLGQTSRQESPFSGRGGIGIGGARNGVLVNTRPLRRTISREDPVEATTLGYNHFTPQPIEVSIDPFTSPSTQLFQPELVARAGRFRIVLPRNLANWLMLVNVYSFVMLMTLMVANSIPNSQLFTLFTAYWSLILYFTILDDGHGKDPFETIAEAFVKKPKVL